MDTRRLVLFILLSLGVLLVWQKYFAPKEEQTTNNLVSTTNKNANIATNGQNQNQMTDGQIGTINQGKSITVTTDVIQAIINTQGGDLVDVNLLRHGMQNNPKVPYKLLSNENGHTFVAQSGLIGKLDLANHNSIFSTDSYNYVLSPDKDTLQVSLKAESLGVQVIKTYTFKRNSYTVLVNYQIMNNSNDPLTNMSAYFRLLRDGTPPEGETKFVRTFTGPAYYTDEAKFNTIKFDKLINNDITYPEMANNGWVGFVQHYFTAMWLLNGYSNNPVCTNGVSCRFSFKPVDGNLVSAGVLTDLPSIAAHSSYSIGIPLFLGPQEYNILVKTAPHLELTKDYGWVYIFSTPLFWLLVKLYDIVKNWGYAIILLTLIVKSVLYPLTRASYISMAKMKALAPKIEGLKSQYGDDKVKLQKAMMEIYRSEKVNPIGGCLPMILQIPVFIGLYWALLSSVELRQASFLWIHDLSTPDPFYILPVVLAATMFIQTFLSPPPSDPVQAKMMRIMPMAFSVMFFFFPAGLVLYWLINNVLSIAQQWYVNNHVTLRRKDRVRSK